MISQEQSLRAYAITLKSLSASELVPLLADDFRYSSQAVVSEIESKHAFVDYISTKLEAIRKSGVRVWAEMGQIQHGFPGPCVVIAQGKQEEIVALVLATVKNGKITRLDMCTVAPHPSTAVRSGEYPSP
jgi:hypothetical protein